MRLRLRAVEHACRGEKDSAPCAVRAFGSRLSVTCVSDYSDSAGHLAEDCDQIGVGGEDAAPYS